MPAKPKEKPDERCQFAFDDDFMVKLHCRTHDHWVNLVDPWRRRSTLQMLIEKRLLSAETLLVVTKELSTLA